MEGGITPVLAHAPTTVSSEIRTANRRRKTMPVRISPEIRRTCFPFFRNDALRPSTGRTRERGTTPVLAHTPTAAFSEIRTANRQRKTDTGPHFSRNTTNPLSLFPQRCPLTLNRSNTGTRDNAGPCTSPRRELLKSRQPAGGEKRKTDRAGNRESIRIRSGAERRNFQQAF